MPGGTIGNLSALVAARQTARARPAEAAPARRPPVARRRDRRRALLDRLGLRGHGRRAASGSTSTSTWRLTGDRPARGAARSTGPRRSSPSWPRAARPTSASSTTSPRSPRSAASSASGSTSTAPTAAPASPRPRCATCYDGIEHADSFIVDPHKWLFAPFDCCALLYREPALARAAHTQKAGYLDVLTEAPEWNPTDYSIGLTRRARGLPFWFSLATSRHRRLHRGDRAHPGGDPLRRGRDRAGAPTSRLVREPRPVGRRLPPAGLVAAGLPGVVATGCSPRSSPSSCPTSHDGETLTRFAIVNPEHHRGRHHRHPRHDGLTPVGPRGPAVRGWGLLGTRCDGCGRRSADADRESRPSGMTSV